jgi:hypothetical protein
MVGCTTGTASKWRVGYVARRLAGVDETGEGGADSGETNGRILKVLDGAPPDQYGRWRGPVIRKALGDAEARIFLALQVAFRYIT